MYSSSWKHFMVCFEHFLACICKGSVRLKKFVEVVFMTHPLKLLDRDEYFPYLPDPHFNNLLMPETLQIDNFHQSFLNCYDHLNIHARKF